MIELPQDILYCIAEYLPLESVVCLGRTCRALFVVFLDNKSPFFRAFVRDVYPSIETFPYFREGARALVARSKALERHAVTARFVLPPLRDTAKLGFKWSTRRDNPTIGYRPVIDSYESWNGGRWLDRTEVLAWGAGEEVIIRIRQLGSPRREKWLAFNDLVKPP